MKRLFPFVLLLVPLFLNAGNVVWSELPIPAGPDSSTPALTSARDGNVYASWTAPAKNGQTAFWMSRYDRELASWQTPVQISSGPNWFINQADKPTISAGLRGRVAATWSVQNKSEGYHTMTRVSEDHGTTWSSPRQLTSESDRTEFATLSPLINGSWLAVWLDARDREKSGNMQLRSRILGSEDPDSLVDERVCDCCAVSTLVLPNGSVLTAYRDRSESEVRDIAYRSYRRGEWFDADAPAQDGWKIEGCPVNGPSLSRRSGHVATAWFTGANETSQVLTARSSNLGRTWNLVSRIDDPAGPATGHVSSVVLRDGSQWVSWVEASGTTALRGLNRDGSLSPISRIAGTAEGMPVMVILNNNSNEAAELLIARQESGGVKTYIGRIAADANATLDDCGCDPGEAANRGHAVRGKVVEILWERSALLVAHEEVPGVMMAMTMSFQVDPRVLDLVKPDQTLLARMEQRADGKWWLFSIRILSPAR